VQSRRVRGGSVALTATTARPTSRDGVNCPSGIFNANAAWLLAATLAHNLIRWTQLIGAPSTTSLTNAKAFRRRLLTIPGRITRTARRWTLHLPSRWSCQHVFEDALARLRAIPAPM
jgi:hypothetical protein